MTIAACYRAGARGGRAHVTNLRLRKSQLASASERLAPVEETAAEAIATLNRQFPWLRGARRFAPHRLQWRNEWPTPRHGRARNGLAPPNGMPGPHPVAQTDAGGRQSNP